MLSIAMVIMSHIILRTIKVRKDGMMQTRLCSLFSAMRLYFMMLAINMVANVITDSSVSYGFYLVVVANVWLLYSFTLFCYSLGAPEFFEMRGPAGATGPMGPIGSRGDRSEQGKVGEAGDKGDKGERGNEGKTGEAGSI
jgi:hypothetical protein